MLFDPSINQPPSLLISSDPINALRIYNQSQKINSFHHQINNQINSENDNDNDNENENENENGSNKNKNNNNNNNSNQNSKSSEIYNLFSSSSQNQNSLKRHHQFQFDNSFFLPKRPNSKRKRLNNSHPKNSKNSSISSISSTSSKDQIFHSENSDYLNLSLDQDQLPSLPSLPPTPLTPHEIIHSNTLAPVFKKSNRVFLQIADSTTNLVESDISICNRLTELVEILRGDLRSRFGLELLHSIIKNQSQNSTQNQNTTQRNLKPSSSLNHLNSFNLSNLTSHPEILNLTPDLIQSLFTSNHSITIPTSTFNQENQNPSPSKKINHSTLNNSSDIIYETLSTDQQIQSFENSVIQLTKFLGDLSDYRDRLLEIRNGCLAIEKRRRAMWSIIKSCANGFDDCLEQNHSKNYNSPNQPQLDQIQQVKIDNHHHHPINNQNLSNNQISKNHSNKTLNHQQSNSSINQTQNIQINNQSIIPQNLNHSGINLRNKGKSRQ